jgi:hypothetical protein
MNNQKPTKEQEEALKDVLEDECLTWEFEETSILEKIHDFFVYKIWGRVHSAYCEAKYLSQKIFRKSHLSDMDNWECAFCIAKDSFRRVKTYRAMNRHGYPGSLNNIEEWDEILDEIILKLELWIKLSEIDGYESMCKEHGWEYPYAKKIENKYVDYIFEGKDGSSVHTWELDYDIKNPDYTYSKRHVGYFNSKALEELNQKAKEGLLLFAKWLPDMWD